MSICNSEEEKSLSSSQLIEEQRSDLAPTSAPYPCPTLSLATALRQYSVVLAAQLSSYRGSWIMQTFISLMVPFALIFSARALIGTLDIHRAIFLLGGNMTMSIAFGPTTFLISKLGWSRQNHEFDYWLALPVPKLTIVLAIISTAVLFALPGMLGSYLLGSLLLGLPLTGAWTLLFLIPLGVLPLAGVGAFLGTFAPNGQTATLLCNLLIFVVGFLSPMFIPPGQLPRILQITCLFIPTTYVADAFRSVLGANFGDSFVFDIIVLLLCSIVCLTLAHWKMEWRTA
jgi:ABC-2 type transport system permease protein